MKNCLIFGSGRSGTSMLAGTLFKAGYYMGDNLYPPRESNPKGFFENAFINGLNEKILIKTREKNRETAFPYPPLQKGQMWLEVLPLNIRLYSTPAISKLIKKAISHIPFCYKDPRFSYTLPVWEKYLKEETINLIIFRHPAITAESIIKECKRMKYLKDVDMYFERAIKIWESIYLHILKNFKNRKNWIFIHYEQLFEESTIAELEKILDTKLDKDFPDLNLKRTMSDKKIPENILEIYERLSRLANFKEKKITKFSINTNKKIDEEYYIKMDIELLNSKKDLNDDEQLRLARDLIKIGKEEEAIKWLKKIIQKGITNDTVFKALILLNEISKKMDIKIKKEIFIKQLNFMIKRKNKNNIDIYNIASMYQRLNDLKNSKKWFKRLFKNNISANLLSGIYFHLGEMEYESGNLNKALIYFKKCLTLNPEHKKAKEYLEKIENKKTVSISLITTCKGRLKYLKESLPSWLALDYDNYDIIIVDYDDPDGTEEYIKKNREKLLSNSKAKNIKVVKVKNKPLFNLNDARNRGVDFSNSEIIFMIDSDIIIKDKKILKRINKEYKNGVIFWSNLPVLNSNFIEMLNYYKIDFKIDINVYSILPFTAVVPDITGTSAFVKKYWKECGEYELSINQKGYGFDEREFYLRYLNFIFYNCFFNKDKERIEKQLDDFIKKIKVFDFNIFKFQDNTLEEKGRFYTFSSRESNINNKIYIKDFFLGFFNKIKFKNNKKDFLIKQNRKRKIQENIPYNCPEWFVSFFYYLGGRKYYNNKEYDKAINYFRKSLKYNNVKDYYFIIFKAKSYYFIYKGYEITTGKKYKKYIEKAIETLKEIKRKKYKDYLMLIDIYIDTKNFSEAIKLLKNVLKKKNIDNEDKFVFMFKYALLKYKLENDKKYFKKSLKLLNKLKKDKMNLYRKASVYKYIEEFDKAEKLFKSLIDKKNDDSFNSNIYFHIGEINYFKNNINSAIGYFKKSLNLNPVHLKAKEYLSYLKSKESSDAV